MEKTLRYRFVTRNDYSVPITRQQVVLHCTPRADEGQTILQSELKIEPEAPLRPLRDGLGNEIYCVSLNEPHSELHYTATGVVCVRTDQPAEEPHPLFSLPGTLTQPGKGIRRWFTELALPPEPPRLAKILCNAIHDRIAYCPGVTDTTTTAEQTLACGVGVCQDFTHLFVTAARLAGLPARYCSGLTIGEGSTHAWPEVYYDGGWHGFDPTRGNPCDASYLRLAVGRDAAECLVERGVFCGACTQLLTVFMQVEEVRAPAVKIPDEETPEANI